MQTLIKAE